MEVHLHSFTTSVLDEVRSASRPGRLSTKNNRSPVGHVTQSRSFGKEAAVNEKLVQHIGENVSIPANS